MLREDNISLILFQTPSTILQLTSVYEPRKEHIAVGFVLFKINIRSFI